MQSWFYDCIKYLCMRPVHFCLFNWYITNLRSQIRFDIQSAWICEWYSKRNKSYSLTHWGHNCFPLSFRWAPSIRNISAQWMNFCRKMNIFVHAFEMFDTCGVPAQKHTYTHFGVYTIKSKATERKDWMFTKLLTVKLSMWLWRFETQTTKSISMNDFKHYELKSNGRSPTRICT